jgi:hypothetical protein
LRKIGQEILPTVLYGAKKMNMISTGAFLTEVDASNKQDTLVSKLVSVWEKKNSKTARAGGVSLMALSLAACGSSDDSDSGITQAQVDAAVAAATAAAQAAAATEAEGVATDAQAAQDAAVAAATAAATPAVEVVPVVTSYSATTGGDTRVGSAEDDNFSGIMSGAQAAGSTIQGGDSFDGGAGNDTLTIYVSGDAGAAFTIGGVIVSNMETVAISNYDVNAGLTTVDMSTMSGVTNISLVNSSATGDTTFSAIQALAGAAAKGAGNMTLTYAATTIAGTADVQNVTFDTYTGTFAAAGIETLNITTTNGNSTLADLTATSATSVTVAGDKNLTVTADVTTGLNAATSIDASAMTGKLNITSSDTSLSVFKGGTGDDTLVRNIQGSDSGAADNFDGGAGTDTLSVTTGANVTSANMGNYTNFERLTFTDGGTTTTNMDGVSGFGIIRNTDDTNGEDTTISNVAAGTVFEITAGGAGNEETTVTLKTDTSSDATTLTLGGTTTGVDVVFQGDNYETINVVSQGAANLVDIDDTDLTTLNVSGSKGLTLSTGSSAANLATIDASALTGAFVMEAAEGKSTIAITTGSGGDTVRGGTSHNVITTNGGADTVIGLAGNNTIKTGDGADTIQFGTFANLTASDTIDGGAGTDTLSFTAAADADFTSSTTLLNGVTNVEAYSFTGLDAADTVTINDTIMNSNAVTLSFTSAVSGTANVVNASGVLNSSNTVNFTDSSTGTTTYSVGNGIDNVTLNAGADIVTVSVSSYLSASDSINGGAGTDILNIDINGGASAAAIVTVGATQLAALSSVETMNVDDNAATYIGLTLTDAVVDANATSQALSVVAADAAGIASSALVTIDASGVTNTAVLTLTGGAAVDTISGGAGSDEIQGNGGNDALSGGAGSDDFNYAATGNGVDTISDFSWGTSATTVDQIDINAMTFTVSGSFDLVVTDATAFAADEDVVALVATTYADLAAVDTAYEARSTVASAADDDLIVLWQDTFGKTHVSVAIGAAGTEAATDDANEFTFTDLATINGSVTDIAGLLNTGDFIVA